MKASAQIGDGPRPGFLVRLIATGFFTGYIPFASGTFGSLAGCIVLLIPGFWSPEILWPAVAVALGAGVVTSSRVARYEGNRLNLLAAQTKDTGLTVLLIEHDLPRLVPWASRLVAMRQGRILFDGPPIACSPPSRLVEEPGDAIPTARSGCSGERVLTIERVSFGYNGHGTALEGVSLSVAGVLFSALQTDPIWTVDAIGYNFRHVLDVSAQQAFSIAGRRYLIEYQLTPAVGQMILVRFRINVI